MKFLRILAAVVAVGFLFLLLVGFDNLLELFRSRVALFLVLGPIVILFVWSVFKLVTGTGKPRKKPQATYIDITPPPKA